MDEKPSEVIPDVGCKEATQLVNEGLASDALTSVVLARHELEPKHSDQCYVNSQDQKSSPSN